MNKKKDVTIITTGGTIEKTYNEFSGILDNHVSVLDILLMRLDLRGVNVHRQPLMNKDSLAMTAEDHAQIAAVAMHAASQYDGVIVVHGTDRLAVSGEAICALGKPKTPIVFTGAMVPYAMKATDATQNVTEALCAVQLLPPGVWLAMHNKVLQFPGVVKDRDNATFHVPQR